MPLSTSRMQAATQEPTTEIVLELDTGTVGARTPDACHPGGDDEASARVPLLLRIVVDLLTLQVGRIADAHSLVYDPDASHPTGRYTTAVCRASAPEPVRLGAEAGVVSR